MLCAIFSDSHGDTISLEKAIIKSRAYGEIDYYFYLGDGISDILYMAIKFDLLLNKNVFAVKGNNDFFNSKFNYE
ncbi:MAG: hypothetical protein GYA87_03840, partial [Christensenellaceae bacterium]|nr:hypothetical protein [Christensenellaceae bacterium]